MSTDTKIWFLLEEFAKRKYPDYVKESLMKCGYDSFESLGMLCDESITDMEDYLKTKFLPAHKDFILDIPDQIEKIDAKEKPQQSKRKKKTEADNPLCNRRQRKKIEEGKVKCKSDKSQGLKSQLVDTIRKYVKSNDLIGNENMTNDNVIGFKRCSATEKYLYQCYFKCPFCEKSCLVKCNQVKTWDTKNMKSHLNKYHKKGKDGTSSAPTSSTEPRAYSIPVIQNVYTMHASAAGRSSIE